MPEPETLDAPITRVVGRALARALDGAAVLDDLGAPTAGDYGDPVAEYESLRDDAARRRPQCRWRGAASTGATRARSSTASFRRISPAWPTARAPIRCCCNRMGKLTADFRAAPDRCARSSGSTPTWASAPLLAIGVEPVQDPGAGRDHRRHTRLRPDHGARAERGGAGLGCTRRDRARCRSTHTSTGTGARVVRADWVGNPGVDVVGPRAAVEAGWDALVAAGVARAGLTALEVVRIEAGVPRQGHELDERRSRRRPFSNATRCRSRRAASSARSSSAASTRAVM